MADGADPFFSPGKRFDAELPDFAVRLTFLSPSRLGLEGLTGPDAGVLDEVEYRLERNGDGTVLLSWRDDRGTCVVHAIGTDLRIQAFIIGGDGLHRANGRMRPVKQIARAA